MKRRQPPYYSKHSFSFLVFREGLTKPKFYRWAVFYGAIASICTTGVVLIPLGIIMGRMWHRHRFPPTAAVPDLGAVIPTACNIQETRRGSSSSPGSDRNRVRSNLDKAPSYSAVVSSGDSYELRPGPQLPPRNRSEPSGFRDFPSARMAPDQSPHSKSRMRSGSDGVTSSFKNNYQSYLDAVSRDSSLPDGMVPCMGTRLKTSQRASTPFPSSRASASRTRNDPTELSPNYNTVGIVLLFILQLPCWWLLTRINRILSLGKPITR